MKLSCSSLFPLLISLLLPALTSAQIPVAPIPALETAPAEVQGKIGFDWQRREKMGQLIHFHFGVPRSHPTLGYCHNTWWFAAYTTDPGASASRLDKVSFATDPQGNGWVELKGSFDRVTYYVAGLGFTTASPWVVPTPKGPCPYPDWKKNGSVFGTGITDCLKPGKHIESDHPALVTLAKQLAGPAGDPKTGDMWQAAQNICVSSYFKNMPYDSANLKAVKTGYLCTNWTDDLDTALEVHQRYIGVCATKARLAAALCRAVGIPARVVQKTGLHLWTEAWINGPGWVPMEITGRQLFPKPISGSAQIMTRISGREDNMFFYWTPKVKSWFELLDSDDPAYHTWDFVNKCRGLVVRVAQTRLEEKYRRAVVSIPLDPYTWFYIMAVPGAYEARTFDRRNGKIVAVKAFSGPTGQVQISTLSGSFSFRYSRLSETVLHLDQLQ